MDSRSGGPGSPNCPWECRRISRLPLRKALRWCASGPPCSGPGHWGQTPRPGAVERAPKRPALKGRKMPGVWKKTLQYLGLVEDEEFDDLEEVDATGPHPETSSVQRIGRPEMATGERPEAIVRTMPASR